MTYKVGAKGQVVLPKELRERHGIRPGDEVLFDDELGQITIRKAETKSEIIARLRGSLADPDDGGRSMTDELIAERRRDREREDRKLGLA
jgi:AbrB family looped-hinge helix DNA binding protein